VPTAFAYMRKSSVRDMATEIGPETQEREVRALAARTGTDPDSLVFLSDWDISGRAEFTSKREGYLSLVDAVENGQCSAVYSYSLSRLGRSVAELARFFDLCAKRHVPIRLVVDAVDTSTASGRLLANVLASVAQFEAEVAGERLKAMYETKRTRAIDQGEDPRDAVRTSRRYGEADGESGQAVLDALSEGGNFSAAARLLNERGVAARNGRKWWSSSVAAVASRLDPAIGARRGTRGARAGVSAFRLARLLHCPTCGHVLTGSNLPDGQGGTRTRYACRFAESSQHGRVTISESLILPAVEAEAAHYWNRDEQDEGGETTVEARRSELLARRERLFESRLDGLVSRHDAAKRAAEIDNELNQLQRPPRPDMRLPAQRSPAEVNAILRQLFERIELDADFRPARFVWRHPEWREPDLKDR
jgi:DNA invertase Pin-like site-specific DNA recombinase